KSGACANVHPSEENGCAVFFDIPAGVTYANGKSHKEIAEKGFDKNAKELIKTMWELENPGTSIPPNTPLDHKTPKMAGGCKAPSNVTPRNYRGSHQDCNIIEKRQSDLEAINGML